MKKVIFIILFLISTAAGFYLFNKEKEPSPETVAVSFSHYVHTVKRKIKCKNCHQGIEKQERASIPNIETCSTCHSEIINPTSQREKQVYNYVKNNKLIPWQNYYVVPDYVFFSHRRHVKLGKIECVNCHGDMTLQTSPILKNFKPFKMNVCFDCHAERKVTLECNDCHR